MGIPRKFKTRGYTLLPFDFGAIEDEEILPNMYWYYGQQKPQGPSPSSRSTRTSSPPSSPTSSCAPDSFILHYLRWISNTKPFLVLELDSHTAGRGRGHAHRGLPRHHRGLPAARR